jgi:hypothetical protein
MVFTVDERKTFGSDELELSRRSMSGVYITEVGRDYYHSIAW